jgi:hypothetical protein
MSQSENQKAGQLLGDRLTVGQVPLEHLVQVRILVAQPTVDQGQAITKASGHPSKAANQGYFETTAAGKPARSNEVNSICTSRGNHAQYKASRENQESSISHAK